MGYAFNNAVEVVNTLHMIEKSYDIMKSMGHKFGDDDGYDDDGYDDDDDDDEPEAKTEQKGMFDDARVPVMIDYWGL